MNPAPNISIISGTMLCLHYSCGSPNKLVNICGPEAIDHSHCPTEAGSTVCYGYFFTIEGCPTIGPYDDVESLLEDVDVLCRSAIEQQVLYGYQNLHVVTRNVLDYTKQFFTPVQFGRLVAGLPSNLEHTRFYF